MLRYSYEVLFMASKVPTRRALDPTRMLMPKKDFFLYTGVIQVPIALLSPCLFHLRVYANEAAFPTSAICQQPQAMPTSERSCVPLSDLACPPVPRLCNVMLY